MHRAQWDGWDESDARTFYLRGKLASELPQPAEEDHQQAAALYRAVCGGNLAVVKFLLENRHNPNVPYYYRPIQKISVMLRPDHDLGLSVEDHRGSFQYPLHRAVLLNNLELVALLLNHGADPNAVDGRSNTPLAIWIKSNNLMDHAIVETLIVGGVDKEASIVIACHGIHHAIIGGDMMKEIKWSVVKTLLHQGADVREVLRRSNGVSFLNVITLCGFSQERATAYEVLGEFMDSELDERLLKTAMTLSLFSLIHVDIVRKLAMLLEVGVPADYNMGGDIDGDGHTHLHLRFVRIEAKLAHDTCPEQVSYTLCIHFSCVWILVKAGAQLVWPNGGNIIGSDRLKHIEERLNMAYDTAEASSDSRRLSILGLLQHCKDIMTKLHGRVGTPSLFDLSVVAVRGSLGLYPGRKLRNTSIPQSLQDAVLLRDLWPFVEKTERCLSHEHSTRSWDDVHLHV